jgi:hypothetical protein
MTSELIEELSQILHTHKWRAKVIRAIMLGIRCHHAEAEQYFRRSLAFADASLEAYWKRIQDVVDLAAAVQEVSVLLTEIRRVETSAAVALAKLDQLDAAGGRH